MNVDTGEYRLITTESPEIKPNEREVAKMPDPNCRTCKGVGHNGINPRTNEYHSCLCTLKGYKDRKV